MIRFLLKSVFWLSLAFIVMPRIFPTDQENSLQEKAAPAEAGRKPDSIDQLLANGRTAVEIGKLCLDNPSFCESGTSLVSNAGSGFLEGSRVVLEYLSDRFGGKPQPSAKADPAIPLPTPREEALRMIDHGSTGAIHR